MSIVMDNFDKILAFIEEVEDQRITPYLWYKKAQEEGLQAATFFQALDWMVKSGMIAFCSSSQYRPAPAYYRLENWSAKE